MYYFVGKNTNELEQFAFNKASPCEKHKASFIRLVIIT